MKNIGHGYQSKTFLTIIIILAGFIFAGCTSGSGSVPVNPPSDNLTVEPVHPTNGELNVPLDTDIELSFSESVNDVSRTTVLLRESTPYGKIVPFTNPVKSGNTYFFKIQNNILNPHTKYFLYVSNKITSVETESRLPETTFSFITSNEIPTPKAYIENPKNDSTNVPLSTTNIQLHFSEPVTNVTESTIKIYSGSESNSSIIIESISSQANGTNYEVSLKSSLDYSTVYYVELNNGITTKIDSQPLETTTFHFTTMQNNTAPSVHMVNPVNNSVIESINPKILIQFSESVTGVSPTTVTLHSGDPTSSNIPIKIEPESNNSYKLVLSSPLNGYTSYFVVIQDGIYSAINGQPVSPTNFNFKVTGPRFGYVVSQGNVKVCNLDSKSGVYIASSCKITVDSKHTYKISINPAHTFAYLSSEHDNSVTVCKIKRSDGTLNNCVETGTGYFEDPSSVTVNESGNFAYITNSPGIPENSYMSVCSVDQTTGELSNCSKTGKASTFYYTPNALVIDKTQTYAYISSDYITVKCLIDESSGALNDCNGIDSTASTGIVLLNDYFMYLSTTTNVIGLEMRVNRFPVSYTISSSYTNLIDMTSYNNSIYLADAGTGVVTVCHRDSIKFNSCLPALENNTDLTGIAVLIN